jgi:hypothetical protein
MDKVQNPSNSECDTPSSEPFRIESSKLYHTFVGYNLLLLFQILEFLHILLKANNEVKLSYSPAVRSSRIETTQFKSQEEDAPDNYIADVVINVTSKLHVFSCSCE